MKFKSLQIASKLLEADLENWTFTSDLTKVRKDIEHPDTIYDVDMVGLMRWQIKPDIGQYGVNGLTPVLVSVEGTAYLETLEDDTIEVPVTYPKITSVIQFPKNSPAYKNKSLLDPNELLVLYSPIVQFGTHLELRTDREVTVQVREIEINFRRGTFLVYFG